MEYILLGDGGHSRVIREMIHEKFGDKVVAILDDKYTVINEKTSIIYGPLSLIDQLLTENRKVVIAIGSNQVRKKIQHQLKIDSFQYGKVIHSSAIVSSSAFIGNGTVIMPGVYINAGVSINEHCIINTGAIIEHDTKINSFVHISPNATLTGNVSIDEGVHIGASSTVIPGKCVGSWSTVGAGSTVIKNIPSQCTAVGCPTRIVSEQVKNNMEIRL